LIRLSQETRIKKLKKGVERNLCAPYQNVYIESFYGRFRDECLNAHWFTRQSCHRGAVTGIQRGTTEEGTGRINAFCLCRASGVKK